MEAEQEQTGETPLDGQAPAPSPKPAWQPRDWVRPALVVAVLTCSAVLPVIPMFVGTLLVIATVVHATLPELRLYLDPVLRIPVGRPAMRRQRLLIVTATGVLLLSIGLVGATVGGNLRGQWTGRRQRETPVEQVEEIVAEVRGHLSRGDFARAEYTLLNTRPDDPSVREAVSEWLDRLRRSGDYEAILDTMIELSPEELGALEAGTFVPDGLEFDDPILTDRAVRIARERVDEARRRQQRR